MEVLTDVEVDKVLRRSVKVSTRCLAETALHRDVSLVFRTISLAKEAFEEDRDLIVVTEIRIVSGLVTEEIIHANEPKKGAVG